ncbi:zinc finger protein 276 isoform X1 [Scophthalmus maximus]|uniref:zinc finger protein 276 isoform X1 n=2 Tax=Scophthalmus maximus TaxID=52904 RepID=UPI001FA84E76|nr:zinc finger protein 276 isoform X1 [Scophthalmus maximus]
MKNHISCGNNTRGRREDSRALPSPRQQASNIHNQLPNVQNKTMKKKTRRPRSKSDTTASIGVEKRTPGNRGRPQKTGPVAADEDFYQDDTSADKTTSAAHDDTHGRPENKSRSSGRLSTALCRLCHGKFSPRSLRHAFNRRSRDSVDIVDHEDEDDKCDAAAAQSPLLFHTDFQRLVGVQLNRDPRLSEFICKKCHTKFYKCHGILLRFLQRVNLPPVGKENLKSRKNTKCPELSGNQASMTPPSSFTSDPQCLHGLVSWAHQHGEACRSCPGLREVLQGRCWGSVRAVWGCVDGHRYVMNTRGADATSFGSSDRVMSEEEEEEVEGEEKQQPGGNGGLMVQLGPPAVRTQTQNSALDWTSSTGGREEATSPAPPQLEDRTADSDASDRIVSDDEFEASRKGALSDDELFEPSSDKRSRRATVPNNKRRRSPKAPVEPKIKKKPGPKPGWKNKLKPKGEELPNIYKCPYQGCTAVYRAPDGLKKHIKEHHEEVRERPCPHPGCNKVFMIDRYLQRHVKLIHTEERNYICDQCGQTFKQRKHLSVHQMRHSGAKPLQCEVCGFQCRQRASLKYHMTKHKAEAELEFACLMCGKRFEKAHNLNVHMSMVHPVIQTEAQRGSLQQQQQQQQPPPYSDLRTITLTGEVVQQDQDR